VKKNKNAAGVFVLLLAGSPVEDAGAEGDSRKQREEEQKQNNKNISPCDTLFRVRMGELGRTNFSTSRLLPVALAAGRRKSSNPSWPASPQRRRNRQRVGTRATSSRQRASIF